MSSVESILSEISKLDNLIYHILEERMTLRGYVYDIANEVKENMFSKGKYYPHYKSDSVYKNSKYNGKQCYLCKVYKYALDRIKKFFGEGSVEVF